MNLKTDDVKKAILKDEVLNLLDGVFKKHQIFLVGGYVRDLFLGKMSYDRDLIVLDCSPEILAEEISGYLNATKITLDLENEIYRVILKDKINYFDITKPFEGDIEKDAKRRDFTINSIFFNLKEQTFFDPEKGIPDIENKKLKTVNLENFKDDPLRLLRAFRFMSSLGYEISQDILDYIIQKGGLINNVARERINYEIIKIFEGDFLVETLLKMLDCNFLFTIFPPLKEVAKIPPNSHHHLDLIHHSIETVKNIRLNKPFLKLSALLHDIGKPNTWTIEESTNRHRFIGHDKKGGEIVKKLLTDFKFSNKQINYVEKMVKYHIYPSSLMQEENVSPKAMMRFVRKLMPDVEDVIELARADRLSARGCDITPLMIENNLKNLKTLLQFYEDIKPNLQDLPKLLNGVEIMEILKIKEGKQLGSIIDTLKEAQILGEVKTKEEAEKFVKNYHEMSFLK